MKTWLAVTGAASLVFLFVWEQVQATRLGFELDGARRGVQEARGHNSYLRLELERRTAPAELALLAHDRLGMLPPSPDAVVMLAQADARPRAPLISLPGPAAITLPRAIMGSPDPAGGGAGAAVASRPQDSVAAADTRLGHIPSGQLSARVGTQLLSWLLPSDLPRWR